MKRSGFTMIELIFVIVILGILAAVAIPKLAATRDDAKIAKGASDVATMVSDLGAYYTANGKFDPAGTNVTYSGTLSPTAQSTLYYNPVTGTNCVKFVLETNGTMVVSNETNSTETLCSGIQDAVSNNKLINTHSFGGSRITI
ncbi:MAG: prepilin-type N-terminal cleavage/methylation domain-containing protein [Sulfuricurvum sp.]|nr:prepilin-type N-terminal cleavage/methylation domain-containing protein [Sulfuricurvum sp.]